MGLPQDWFEKGNKAPATFKILMMELEHCYGSVARVDHTFESWAKQGILMLNKSLSIQDKETKGHIVLWEPFIKHLLTYINDAMPGMVVVLLGREAQMLKTYLNPDRLWILSFVHPAAESRAGGNAGFLRSKMFRKINEILYKQYNFEIKWLPEDS